MQYYNLAEKKGRAEKPGIQQQELKGPSPDRDTPRNDVGFVFPPHQSFLDSTDCFLTWFINWAAEIGCARDAEILL